MYILFESGLKLIRWDSFRLIRSQYTITLHFFYLLLFFTRRKHNFFSCTDLTKTFLTSFSFHLCLLFFFLFRLLFYNSLTHILFHIKQTTKNLFSLSTSSNTSLQFFYHFTVKKKWWKKYEKIFLKWFLSGFCHTTHLKYFFSHKTTLQKIYSHSQDHCLTSYNFFYVLSLIKWCEKNTKTFSEMIVFLIFAMTSLELLDTTTKCTFKP